MSELLHCQPPHPSQLELDLLLTQCEFRAVRGSGPGGQHRNKVSTGIVVTHLPTRICGEATERRSQAQNRDVATTRLRVRLAIRLRTEQDIIAASARLASYADLYGGARLRISESNVDYAAVLASLLDVIFATSGEVTVAAAELATSPSQILRLLRAQPEAIQLVNSWRAGNHRHPLR